MKLLLSGLLLASLRLCISSWSVSSTDMSAVTQSPDVSVMEGDTVTISCCFTRNNPRIRISWWNNNQREIKSEFIYQTQESHSCSNWTFFNITPKDSGRYICTVTIEVPVLSEILGNGTVITVRTKEDGGDDTDHGPSWTDVLIFYLRCLPLLVLLITFFYLNNRLTKAQQHKADAPENTSTSAKRGEEDQEEEENQETPL